ILLPVSYRIIIPPLTSDFLGIFKNSSVALTIGVMEITAQARQIGEYTFNYFETFTAATVLYLAVTFIVLTVLVVLGGVEAGIERWSKILMPILVVLMLLVIIRGLTLPGAEAGLSFYLKPDFSKVNGSTILAALGQAFFSLSLGMGAMITYGSYLSKDSNLRLSGTSVAMFDTIIALMAGFMIFPALFAMGKDPAAGPTLIFVVLPEIFREMPLGTLVGVSFFILLSIAALTSTVSLLEVAVSYFVDERGWSRRKSVWVIGAASFLLGLPAALSQGAVGFLSDMTLFGNPSLMYIMDFIWGNISLAVGALFLSLFVGWIWGADKAGAELAQGSSISQAGIRFWAVFIRWVCPAVIFIVLLNTIGGLGWIRNLFGGP
ncbi:MAG: sodium-dependent transporter, partial [Acidobacteriota bacterium]